MNITINNEEVNIPDSLGDLTLNRYLKVSKLLSDVGYKNEEQLTTYFNTPDGMLLLYDIVELILNRSIDDFNISDSNIIIEECLKVIANSDLTTKYDHFEIDGCNYVTRNIETMNDLTTGENISIEIAIEKNKNELEKYCAEVLAILIRPGKLVRNEEKQIDKWEIEKFDRKSIANLNYRTQILSDKSLAKYVIPTLHFFFSTVIKTSGIMKTYIQQNQEVKKEEIV